jgi:hypothetical protein
MTIKLQQQRANEVTLKFISTMQILKDKGLITDAEITAQLDRNQESVVASSVQPQEARPNEDHRGSKEPEVLDTQSDGSVTDSSSG